MSKLAVAALIALASFASAYNIVVGAGNVECFMEEIQDGEKVVGSYSVLYGGGADIDVKVRCIKLDNNDRHHYIFHVQFYFHNIIAVT
jgi:hypothetical protein